MSEFASSPIKLGKHFGVSERTIERWLREGAPKRTSRGFSVTAWKKWRDNRDQSHGYKRRERTQTSAAARDRIEEAEARIKEMKADQLAGKLVSRDSVIRVWSKYVTIARNLLEQLPGQIELLFPDTEHRSIARRQAEITVESCLKELQEGGKRIE
jgi:phage terminase Nu1 subunit (DNA packaging protein)